jgi:hypothetical protein
VTAILAGKLSSNCCNTDSPSLPELVCSELESGRIIERRAGGDLQAQNLFETVLELPQGCCDDVSYVIDIIAIGCI